MDDGAIDYFEESEDYLHPALLPPGTLARIYSRRSKRENDEELQAVRLSVQPDATE